MKIKHLIFSLFLLTAPLSLCAADAWPEILARMPLAATNVTRLERGNCVGVMLRALRSNDAVKGMVFMPGATDEFYMFRRAQASLTNASPSLWDAVTALTNQTFIRATFHAPLLIFHTDEDPTEPLIEINDFKTAQKLKETQFRKYAYYNDVDWDHLRSTLRSSFGASIVPGRDSVDSWHFFRHCIAGWNLSNWEALQAVLLAGKERVRIENKHLVFEGDTRVRQRPKFEPIVK